jgi:hypothetical protein
MPNFDARIKPVSNKNGKANIKIRVSHKGVVRYIATEHYIEPENFDNEKGRVKPGHPNAADINIELQALELTYQRKVLKMEGRIKDVSVNDLILFLNDTDNSGLLDFISVARNRVEFLKRAGRKGSATSLEQTIGRIKSYAGVEKLPFESINKTWLEGFESWYCLNGSQNSAAIHLRNIRTMFNIAMDDYGLSPELYPFRKFKIKTTETIHRDLDPTEIARLMAFKPEGSFHQTAIDLWLLSFFMVGINFKDLLLAGKTQLKKGRLVYNRHKTKTLYSVKVEPEAEALIKKHAGKNFLLNLIEHKQVVQVKKDRTTQLHQDIVDRTNRTLKTITKAINLKAKEKALENGTRAEDFENVIEPELSTYYARHAWASIASKLEVPHDVIREALGHGRSITDIYIRFYTSRIDEANRKIIDHVVKTYQQGV